MTDIIGRRQVLGGMVALGASLPIGTTSAACGPTVAIRECGTLSRWPLVIAALVATDAAGVDTKIEELRRATGYRRPFRFSATDAGRTGFGEALIALFVRDERLRLGATIIGDNADHPAGPADHDRRYFTAYRGAIGLANADLQPATVQVPRHETLRGELLGMFLEDRGHRVLPPRMEAPSNLAQLAGLLAGCIRADLVGTTDAARQNLIDGFKAACGCARLTEGAPGKISVGFAA